MEKNRLEYYLQYMMSLIGGFLGAYALLNYHGLFGSAQTSNLIYLVGNILGRNFGELLLRLLVLFAYICGLIGAVIVSRNDKLNLQVCSVFFDILAVILMSIMPKGINDFVVLCPVFFATAFQWYSFKGADGYASSSIFSTNNLRQFVTSFFEYLCDKEDSYLNKAKYYGGVLLYYHIGVAVSYISYVVMDARGILICLLPLAGALLLVCSKEGTIKLPGVLKSHS